MLASCGNKATPEEEVRNYGKYFVEKINANQLDSLTASYPDISKADSIVPLQSDTIMVVETTPGQFDVTLAEGITLKVNRSDDGNISVTESKGLFAFPASKMDIAKKTGMWDDKLSDAQLNERMKDDEFFIYIRNKKEVKPSSILSIKQAKSSMSNRAAVMDMDYVEVKNLTDIPVSGKDYYLEDHWYYTGIAMYEDGDNDQKGISKENGKDIPPHGTVKYKKDFGFRMSHDLKIKWKLTPEQLQEKFGAYTGKEYQEYLNSKK